MSEGFSEPLVQVDRVFVKTTRRKLLYFGGCDYYRLSSHPGIIRVIREGLGKLGVSTSASRKTTGNHPLFEKLEKATAEFFSAKSAVLFSSGYLTNIGVAQALRGTLDRIYADERCHGSLLEAASLSGAAITFFKHRDPGDLLLKLKRNSRKGKVAILTDGIFSFDGSIAPLQGYRKVAGAEPILWLDDAHGAGVLGKEGRGSLEHAGVSRRNTIQCITFSKAFGVYGGAVLGDAALRSALIARSSVVSGNTPLPLPLACGCLKALSLLSRARRTRLLRNLAIINLSTPIFAVESDDPARLAEQLRVSGIYPSFIKYPGGPAKGYFRFAISSEHTPEQVRLLARVLRDS